VTPQGLSSLDRGLRVLALVQDRGRVSVAQICADLDMPSSTAYRYVRALQAAGFLMEQHGQLLPGGRMAEESTEGRSHLVDVARPVLRDLGARSGLTVALTVRVHSAALCLDTRRAASMRTTSLAYCPGEIRPLYAGASVTPLLAYAPDDVVDRALGAGLRPFTAATPSAEQIRAELPDIRARGFHITEGWINPGLWGIGVPVLTDGRCLCALSLVGPTPQADPEGALVLLSEAVEQLQQRVPASLSSTWLPPHESPYPITPGGSS
jgi:DNA-binding IclR family transcriptional regulator